MITLSTIETDLVSAMKAKDQVAVDTLRGLKTRIVNEQVAKMNDQLDESAILSLVKSEIKRRKEAAESFMAGGRQETAEKELHEAAILEKYLPAQLGEAEIAAKVNEVLAGGSFTAQDFGKVMGQLKAALGNSADGALIAKVVKEKLK